MIRWPLRSARRCVDGVPGVDRRRTVGAPVRPDVDERAARRTLRAQIAHLERDLGAAVIAAYPRLPAGTARVSHAGPRLLGLEELERIRDDLADRIAEVRAQAAVQGERQAEARLLIERMLLDPGRYKWVAGDQRGHRRDGLQELARPPAARPDRHAGRLVARQDLLRLPVSPLTAPADP